MKKNGSKGARNGGETSKYNFLQGVRSQRNFRQASRLSKEMFESFLKLYIYTLGKDLDKFEWMNIELAFFFISFYVLFEFRHPGLSHPGIYKR